MPQQELLIESKQLTRFIKDAKSLITTTPNSKALISQLTRPFIKILSADFIPKSFMEPLPSTFAQYLIYRNFSPEFSLMAMLVPPGISTPVHDHLAWGLVGVYQGEQKETVYSSRKISKSHQICWNVYNSALPLPHPQSVCFSKTRNLPGTTC